MFLALLFSIIQSKNILDNPISTPVPISISLLQMEVAGNANCESSPNKQEFQVDKTQDIGCEISELESSRAYNCGFRCWTNGASFSYTFKGVKFQLYGTLDPNHGKFDIELDGIIIQEINQHSVNRQMYALLYTSDNLEYKDHIVRVLAKNGNTYELYKFAFWPSLKARRYNSTDFTIKSGNFISESDGIGGNRKYSTGGGEAQIDIQCSKFWFYGMRDINLRILDLTYAGVTEHLDQEDDIRVESVLLYESNNLIYNTETLSLSSTGTQVIYCLYCEDPGIQTESPYPTKTIDPSKPTPEPTPIPTPIPISIGLSQMYKSGDYKCANGYTFDLDAQHVGCEYNVLTHQNAYQCGFRCWSNEASYEYTFTGVKFDIYGTFDPSHGEYVISIDGVEQTRTESGTRQAYAIVFSSDLLEYGEHTVKITPKGIVEFYKLSYFPHQDAKRCNTSEISKTGVWKLESDGIGGNREYTNNAGATATKTISCSRFWIYGTKASHHGSMELIINNQDPININQRQADRADTVLLYDSEDIPYRSYTLNFIAKGTVMINFIYYLDNPPIQTAAPYPSRTPQEIKSSDFINKVFNNIVPNSHVYVSQSSPITQISGCKFNDISEEREYFITLEKEIKIFDNSFTYGSSLSSPSAPFYISYSGKITISRCNFTNSKSRSSLGNVFYCNSQNSIASIFESCQFINCGDTTGQMIIKIESSLSSVTLSNSIFTFDSEKSCKIIDASCSHVYVTFCKFTKCGAIVVSIMNNKGQFHYQNNVASDITKTFISATNLQTPPIISGNVFQNCQINDVYFLTFIHNQEKFYLTNNTFSNIIASADDNVLHYGGAISLWIQKSGYSRGYVFFDECKFYSNKNRHSVAKFAQGGALQLGYSSSVANVTVEFNKCEFKDNECVEGKGGAIGIDVAHDVILSDCVFERNKAAKEGGAIYIWGKVVKPEEQQAPDLPDGIQTDYIRITNCQFISNEGSTGTAFYIEEEQGNVNIDTLNISSCTFIDNTATTNEKDQVLIHATCTVFNFESNTVLYNGDKTVGAIILKETEDAILLDSTFTRCQTTSASIQIGASNLIMSYCTFNECGKEDVYAVKFNNESYSYIQLDHNVFNSCKCTYRLEGNYKDEKDPLIIQNITINNAQNTVEDAYTFIIDLQRDIDLVECKFSSCYSNKQQGGGCGANLITSSKIKFDNCEWFNNSCGSNGGAFHAGGKDSNLNDKVLEFISCNFTQNKTPNFGGALSLETYSNVSIVECTFLRNQAGFTQSSQMLDEQNGYGGAVYINPETQSTTVNKPVYTFANSKFIENTAVDAHAIYITNSNNKIIISLENVNSFIDNGQSGSTIISDQKINVDDSKFETSEDNPGSNPIEYEGNFPVEFTGQTFHQQINIKSEQQKGEFIDCKFLMSNQIDTSQTQQYVINVHCYTFIFDNCSIEFTNAESAYGGICIDAYCNVTIVGSSFSKCNVQVSDQSSGIYYEPKNGYSTVESFYFADNVFKEISGVSDRCFRIKIDYLKLKGNRNITIRDSPSGGNTGAFYFTSSTSSGTASVKFDNWKFIQNVGNSKTGGCGLLITSASGNSLSPHPYFTGCTWKENKNTDGDGGAFHFGSSDSNVNVQLTFDFCEFNENTASLEGGALCIRTSLQCSIQNCTFTGNSANKGGALFIEPKSQEPKVMIYNCNFNSNIAKEGLAISISGSANYDFDNLQFKNNHNNKDKSESSVLYSTSSKLDIDFSVFECTDKEINNRAMAIVTEGEFNFQNTTFRGFNLNGLGNGGAVMLDPLEKSLSLLVAGTYEFQYCLFEACKNSGNGKGGAFYSANIPTLRIRNTEFVNCAGNGAILYVESSVEKVILEYNKYRNMTDKGNYMFVSGAQEFKFDGQGLDDETNTMGAFNITEANELVFEDLIFSGLSLGPRIGKNVKDAIIRNCTFIDCYNQNSISSDDWGFVIEIHNTKFLFDNNTIIFSENATKKAAAILIDNNGDIKVINNKFINCHSGGSGNIGGIYPTFKFNPPEISNADSNQQVIFNYNFIQGVATRKMCLFDINYINQNFNLDHNIFKDCYNNNTGNNGYMGEITNIKVPEFILTNTTFEDCKSGSEFGGAIGIWFTANNYNENKKLSFIECKFINNKHTFNSGGGAFQMGDTTNAHFELLFESCIFNGNTAAGNGGALCIGGGSDNREFNKPVTIHNCTFENNKALGNYNEDIEDIYGYGGAIYLHNNRIEVTLIENCIFNNNFDEHGDGNAIYILNEIESSNKVEIPSCTFHNNYNSQPTSSNIHNFAISTKSPFFNISHSNITSDDLNYKISAINFIGVGSESYVYKVIFERCCSLENSNAARALAIDINYNTKKVEITFCQFKYCGGNSGWNKYAIYDEGKDTEINNCTFISADPDIRSPAIKINSYGIHKILNCHIENPKCSTNGAVAYLPEDNEIVGNYEDEDFEFKYTTIKNAIGSDRVALDLNLRDETKVDIRYITTRDCKDGSCLVGIEIYDTASGFTFENFTFIDNICHASFGGGSGIWIEMHSKPTKNFHFQFNECSFIRNEAKDPKMVNGNPFGNGGALQLSGDAYQADYYSYGIKNCIFEENKADENGGAIEWHSRSDFFVEGCKFIRNEASVRDGNTHDGGAIYINPSNVPNSNEIAITECTFEDNKNYRSSAIFIDDSHNSNCNIRISDCCQFIINTKSESSLIRAKCKNLRVSNLTFDMKDIQNSCRAIYLECPSNSPQDVHLSPDISNVTFINCCCNKEGDNGNAIYIEKLSSSLSHMPTINSCQFIDCGNKGWAVYSLDPKLYFEYNTITYTSNAKEKAGGGYYAVGGKIENNTFSNTFGYQNALKNGNSLSVEFDGSNSESNMLSFKSNEFTNCNGEDVRCFYIYLQNYNDVDSEFYNITVRDCPEANALTGYIQVESSKNGYLLFSKCTWVNNKVRGNGGGAGIALIGYPKFEFCFQESCLFENNTVIDGNGGALQITKLQDYQASTFICTIKESTFRNNQAVNGGAIAIEITGKWSIENSCIFENNKATNRGGAIYVNGNPDENTITDSSSISESTFYGNKATSHGTIIYISQAPTGYDSLPSIKFESSNTINYNGEEGYYFYNEYVNFELNGIKISYDDSKIPNIGILCADSNSMTKLSDSEFTGVTFSSNSDLGNIIRLYGTSNVIVNNCKIKDCAKESSNAKTNFIFYSSSNSGKVQLQLTSTTIEFTSTTRSCSAICIERYCKLNVNNCNFINCWSYWDNYYPGAIRYGPSDSQSQDGRDESNMIITESTFQNCNNYDPTSNGGRVFHAFSANQNRFENCTIKDTVDGGYTFYWDFSKSDTIVSPAQLTEIIFQDNRANCNQGGGGAGIYIAKADKYIIEKCYFIRNVNTNSNKNDVGAGAFLCEKSDNSNSEIKFEECYFEDNSVPTNKFGGSLYIQCPDYLVSVHKCTFADTRAIDANGVARFGGAIYIDPDTTAGVIIDENVFSHCQSTADGNAILIGLNNVEVKGLIKIQYCSFKDCHHNNRFSVIWSFGKHELQYINNTITFTESAKSSRGLIVAYPSNILIRDSTFHNCVYDEHGCGFAYNPNGGRADNLNIESITIDNSIFDNCFSSSSSKAKLSAIYLYLQKEITFTNVIVQNCNPPADRSIIYIEGNELPEQTIKGCTFQNCTAKFTNNNQGGIGLKHDKIKNLIFDGCTFYNLLTSDCGGAVAFIDQRENANDYSIKFQRCIFNENSVEGNDCKGAALYFDISYTVDILDCNFRSQSINGAGGAIYVHSSSNVLINGNTFDSTKEISSGKGNAIYLARGLPIATISGNNNFINCGSDKKGSVIESEAIEFVFNSNTIRFTNENDGARGFNFPVKCTIRISNSTISGCFSNGEGGGLLFNGGVSTQTEFIQIEGTTFDNNKASNGCALLMKISALPNITGCTITNHRSGKYIFCIFYQIKLLDEVSIEKCTFSNNLFNQDIDGGGSGIWIAAAKNLYDGSYPIGINSCIFKNNEASQFGGAFAYGISDTLKKIMVNFRNCEFNENVAKGGKGGAIWLNTEAECTVDGCSFRNDYIDNNAKLGHAIYLDSRARIYITDTLFTDCGSGGLGNVINFDGSRIVMEDSMIQYSQENNGARGINISVATDVELLRSTFLKCHSSSSNYKGWGGGLYLGIQSSATDSTVLLFEDLTFDNNSAENGCAALFETSIPPDIHGCTIKNHQSGKYVFCIFFKVVQSYYDLKTCIFENNAYNSIDNAKDGGGSGIWIANNKEIAQQRSLQLFLTECQFRDNVSPEDGGAFGIGQSETVKATELILDSSVFTSNHATKRGGAVWIATRSNIEIKNCEFRNNRADETAGSIVIESTAQSCIVSKCTFNRENADSQANSIYINSLTTETYLIENTFSDCGYSSQSAEIISINSRLFEYSENTIRFTNLLNSCRGLTIQSSGTHTIRDSTFSMCNITSDNKYGGGIYYVCPDNDVNNDDIIENILIEGCTFDYCHADSGSAIYLNPKSIPEMSNNVVQNSKTGQFTLTLILKKGSFTDFTLEGWTFYNNRASPKVINANTKYDGGGSGIYISNPASSTNLPFNLTFHKCNWTLNSSPYRGGALAYGDSQELKNINLIFDDCQFVRNSCKKDIAGCLWLSSSSDTSLLISKCIFNANKALSNTSTGGTIYLDSSYQGKVDIIDSEFTKNSAIEASALFIEQNVKSVNIERCSITSNGNTNSQIVNFCRELNIIDSDVGFGAYTLSARSLSCLAKCLLTISRSTFANCKTNDKNEGLNNFKHQGAGLLYELQRNTPNEECIIIEETTFENCRANNGAAIMIRSTKPVVFNKNTIQECRGGNHILCIFSQEYVEEFIYEDLIFRRNKFTITKFTDDTGGSGIWINNDVNKLPINTYNILTFKNCQWIENTADGNGGAMSYGNSDSIGNTALTYDHCQFSDNVANGGSGGALNLHMRRPLLIKDCTFTTNSASGSVAKGGAITINSTATSINIVGCTFKSNSAKTCSGIALTEFTNNANITDCTFIDGKGNNAMHIFSKSVTIDNCHIRFTSRISSNPSRGIYIGCRCTALIRDTDFVNVSIRNANFEKIGGGIYVNTINDLVTNYDEDSLLIEGCLFDNCEADNGQAIYAMLKSPVTLRSNLFWNHNRNFVVTISYYEDAYEALVEDCYFEHNSFEKDPGSGGGSGFWIQRADHAAHNVIFNGCTWRNNTNKVGDGGAFAYGPTNTLRHSTLEFNDCIFINNTAAHNGGAISVQTRANLTIHNCFFDGNKADTASNYYGGAIYIKKPEGNVEITDCKFARNKAYTAGALHVSTPDSLTLNSNIFSENTAVSNVPNLYIIANVTHGKSDQVISNCKFDFDKTPDEYQVYIEPSAETNEVPEFSIIFTGNCFTHTGEGKSIAHIKSDFKGKIQLNQGNCFDLSREFSVQVPNEQNLQTAEGLFDCTTCKVPLIPTSPPTNMPSASPAPTPTATTPPPTATSPPSNYVYPTQTPIQQITTTTSSSETVVPPTSNDATTFSHHSESSSINNGGSNAEDNSKKQSKKIVLIAGIAVAVVVIIVVVIILVWLFVCRNRTSVQQEERTRNTEMNEETISGITGVQESNQTDEDPIWAGTSGTQDNLLFDGNEENNDADEPANNEFEESWGTM